MHKMETIHILSCRTFQNSLGLFPISWTSLQALGRLGDLLKLAGSCSVTGTFYARKALIFIPLGLKQGLAGE
jgi:hypothetical protein